MSHYSEYALAQHLGGFQVPRRLRARVTELISLTDGAQLAAVHKVLPDIRRKLNELSESEGLSLKQQVAIKKAYLVLKGNNSLLPIQLGKEREAISSHESDLAEQAWPTISAGLPDATVSLRASYGLNVIEECAGAILRNGKEVTIPSVYTKVHREVERFSCLPVHIRHNPIWKAVFPFLKEDWIDSSPLASCQDDPFVGQVGFTQEPGLKLRLFASPYPMYQAALHPLKVALQNILQAIPEDFHMDQTSGRQFVQDGLKQGFTAYCFDMSSATHRFPWSVQERMLKAFRVPQCYLDLFRWVSKGRFNSSQGEFQWTSGQPLGTYPSFFAFSLAHHALVRGIFTRKGQDPTGKYCILGDDIVIFDSKVAKTYQNLMVKLGVSINMDKSLISDTVAEFAGSLITRKTIINVGKFRNIGKHNVLSVNTIWSKPEPALSVAVAFRNGTLPESIYDYIKIRLQEKICRSLNDMVILDPARVSKEVVTLLEGSEFRLCVKSYDYQSRTRQVAQFILDLHNACPQCWPDSPVPYYLSNNMIVIEGFKELVANTLLDKGCPVWWHQFLDTIGEAEREYSGYRCIRIISNLLRRLYFVRPQGVLRNEQMYVRDIIKYHRQTKKMDHTQLVDAIRLASLKVGAPPEFVEKYSAEPGFRVDCPGDCDEVYHELMTSNRDFRAFSADYLEGFEDQTSGHR